MTSMVTQDDETNEQTYFYCLHFQVYYRQQIIFIFKNIIKSYSFRAYIHKQWKLYSKRYIHYNVDSSSIYNQDMEAT